MDVLQAQVDESLARTAEAGSIDQLENLREGEPAERDRRLARRHRGSGVSHDRRLRARWPESCEDRIRASPIRPPTYSSKAHISRRPDHGARTQAWSAYRRVTPGLVEALKRNANRQHERIRLFEIARVFHRGDAAPDETRRVAGVVCGRAFPEHWGGEKRAVDFHDIRADLESLVRLAGNGRRAEFHSVERPDFHPGRSAEVRLDRPQVGYVGALHPRLLKALDLDQDVYAFELDLDWLTAGRLPKAVELSRFPQVRRDIAVVVPESVGRAQVENVLRSVSGQVLRDLILFDRYSGAGLGSGLKSLAIGLILQDSYRTLTDQEADLFVASAVAALERECGGRLRG